MTRFICKSPTGTIYRIAQVNSPCAVLPFGQPLPKAVGVPSIWWPGPDGNPLFWPHPARGFEIVERSSEVA